MCCITDCDTVPLPARVRVRRLIPSLPGTQCLLNSHLDVAGGRTMIYYLMPLKNALQTFTMRPVKRKVGKERNIGKPSTVVNNVFQSFVTVCLL